VNDTLRGEAWLRTCLTPVTGERGIAKLSQFHCTGNFVPVDRSGELKSHWHWIGDRYLAGDFVAIDFMTPVLSEKGLVSRKVRWDRLRLTLCRARSRNGNDLSGSEFRFQIIQKILKRITERRMLATG